MTVLTYSQDGANPTRAARSLDGGLTFELMTPQFRFHDSALILPTLVLAGGQQEPLPSTKADLTSVATSLDRGATWTKRNCEIMRVRSLAFGNGVYVAGGEPLAAGQPVLASSPDGVTWTSRLSPAGDTFDVWSVVWTGSAFLAMAPFDLTRQHQYRTSVDGVTWSEIRSLPASPVEIRRAAEHGTVVRDAEVFVYMAEGATSTTEVPVVYRSTDLLTWTRQLLTLDGATWPADQEIYNAHFAAHQGLFLLAAGAFNAFKIQTSLDGVAFTTRSSGLGRPESVGSGPDGLYAGGSRTAPLWARSTDGVTWTNPAHPTTGSLSGGVNRVFGAEKVVLPPPVNIRQRSGRAFFDRV